MAEGGEDISTYDEVDFESPEINEAWYNSSDPGNLRYVFDELRAGSRMNIMSLGPTSEEPTKVLTEIFTKLGGASSEQKLNSKETKAQINILEVTAFDRQQIGESLVTLEKNLEGTKGSKIKYALIDSASDTETIITIVDSDDHKKYKATVPK